MCSFQTYFQSFRTFLWLFGAFFRCSTFILLISTLLCILILTSSYIRHYHERILRAFVPFFFYLSGFFMAFQRNFYAVVRLYCSFALIFHRCTFLFNIFFTVLRLSCSFLPSLRSNFIFTRFYAFVPFIQVSACVFYASFLSGFSKVSVTYSAHYAFVDVFLRFFHRNSFFLHICTFSTYFPLFSFLSAHSKVSVITYSALLHVLMRLSSGTCFFFTFLHASPRLFYCFLSYNIIFSSFARSYAFVHWNMFLLHILHASPRLFYCFLSYNIFCSIARSYPFVHV